MWQAEFSRKQALWLEFCVQDTYEGVPFGRACMEGRGIKQKWTERERVSSSRGPIRAWVPSRRRFSAGKKRVSPNSWIGSKGIISMMSISCAASPMRWHLTERDQMKDNTSGGALGGWEVTFILQLSPSISKAVLWREMTWNVSCPPVTRQAGEKLPYGSLPQESYFSFQNRMPSHVLRGSESIHQDLGQSEVEHACVTSVDTCSVIGHFHGAVCQLLAMANHMGCSGSSTTLHSDPELGRDCWASILLH